MKAIGGFAYTEEERAFAEEIQKHLLQPRPIGSQEEVMEWRRTPAGGSTDVADVSWVVPTAQFRTATWVPGTPAHSWMAVACGGTSIGLKGMHLAAQVLARTGADLFQDSSHLTAALEELNAARGPDFVYEPLLGDRPPPLDYRR